MRQLVFDWAGAGVCALNVWLALADGNPLNWTAAVFAGLLTITNAVRTSR